MGVPKKIRVSIVEPLNDRKMKPLILCMVATVMMAVALQAQESNQDFDDLYQEEKEVMVDQPQPRPERAEESARDQNRSGDDPGEVAEEIVVDLVDFADRISNVLFDLELRLRNSEMEVDVRANDLYIEREELRDFHEDMEDAADDIHDAIEDLYDAADDLEDVRNDVADARRDLHDARRDLYRERELIETIAILHAFEHVGFGIADGILETVHWILHF